MSAVQKLKAEATDQVISFKYRNHQFTIDRDIPVDVLEDIEAGKMATAVRGLLGEKQYEQFKSTKPRVSDLTELLQAATSATGADLGESKA